MEETLSVEEAPQAEVDAPKSVVRNRAPFDTQAIKLLATAESVAVAAQRPESVGPLADREITSVVVAEFLADTQVVQGKFSQVISLRGGSRDAGAVEKAARTALLRYITEVQTAALQKWSGSATNKGDRDAYGIGRRIATLGRPALETVVRTILQRIASDNLPGITPTKIQAFRDALTAWSTANSAQNNQSTDASQLLTEAKASLKDITERRIRIQLAAAAAFPAFISDNAPIRSAFSLPKNRPYRPPRA